jgi:hypothetical protein
MTPRALPGRTINEALSAQFNREVVKIEALPINPGQAVHLRFEGSDSPWRQGVRIATQGELSANGVNAPQLDLWPDTAPSVVEVTCESTDGLLRIYNIWQSGRRPGVESQSHTSGMLVENLADGSRRYRCNDIGFEPSFEKLVFLIAIV